MNAAFAAFHAMLRAFSARRRSTGARAGLAVIGIAVVACTPIEWVKDGVDETAARADRNACSRQAFLSAQTDVFGTGFSRSFPLMTDRSGQTFAIPATPLLSDPQLREQRLFGQCMQEKGYALVSGRR
jgi:hypothetical protein